MSRDILFEKADEYAHKVYQLSRDMPREETFGLTSQLRRAAISVPLNILEGYSRQSRPTQRQFLLVAFGSVKEAQYLLGFARQEHLLSDSSIQIISDLGDEVARMLWAKARTLKKQ